MSNILYIVGQVGFEYNDEVYTQNEGETIVPETAYRNKANAEMAVAELNIAYLLEGESLAYYGYDLSEIFKDVNLAAQQVRKYDAAIADMIEDEDESPYDALDELNKKVLKKMSHQELADFVDNLAISFYTAYEVELTDDE